MIQLFLGIVVCGVGGAIVGIFVAAATCNTNDWIVGCAGEDFEGLVWGALAGMLLGLLLVVLVVWPRDKESRQRRA